MTEFGNIVSPSLRAWTRAALVACSIVAMAPEAKAQRADVNCYGLREERRVMPLQTGTLSVGAEVPLGSVVYRQRFFRPGDMTIRCAANEKITRRPPRFYNEYSYAPIVPKWTYEYDAAPNSLSSWNQGPYAGKVHLTDVPGLGAVYTHVDGRPFPFDVPGGERCPGSRGLNCHVGYEDNNAFDLLLIKIGDVAPGVVGASSLPTPAIRMQVSDAAPHSLIVPVTGSINMLSRTCSTNDVVVPMGTHAISAIADGQSTPWTDFAIGLSNCPGFVGSFTQAGPVWSAPGRGSGGLGHAIPSTGSFTRAGTTPSTLSFRIDPSAAPIDATSGILTLDATVSGGTAEGVGIQISNSSSNPLALGVVHPSGLELQRSERDYSIPLRARYVRSEGTLRPGPANASATFTIIYH